jgi:biopolymer transport protein ExbB
MHALTFREILMVSQVIPVLLVLSVIGLMATLERWFTYMKYGRVDQGALDKIRTLIKNNNLNDAKKEALKSSGFVSEAVAGQIDAVHMPRNERESLVIFYHQRLQSILGKRLWMFGTLSFVCPLIGLLGTVLGVITAFHDLAVSGSGGPTIVAAGISEALYATAAGITVAIIAAVVYNWFNIWQKNALANIDMFSQEIIFLTTGRTHATHTTHAK